MQFTSVFLRINCLYVEFLKSRLNYALQWNPSGKQNEKVKDTSFSVLKEYTFFNNKLKGKIKVIILFLHFLNYILINCEFMYINLTNIY